MGKKNGQNIVKSMILKGFESAEKISAEIGRDSIVVRPHYFAKSGSLCAENMAGDYVLSAVAAKYNYESNLWLTKNQAKGLIIRPDEYAIIGMYNDSTGNWCYKQMYNVNNTTFRPKVEVSPKIKVPEGTDVKVEPKIAAPKNATVEVSPKVEVYRGKHFKNITPQKTTVEVSPKVNLVDTKGQHCKYDITLPDGTTIHCKSLKGLLAAKRELGIN